MSSSISSLNSMMKRSAELLKEYDVLGDQLSNSSKGLRHFLLDSSFSACQYELDESVATLESEILGADVALREATLQVFGAYSGKSTAEILDYGGPSFWYSPIGSSSGDSSAPSSPEELPHGGDGILGEPDIDDLLSVDEARGPGISQGPAEKPSYASSPRFVNSDEEMQFEVDSEGFKKPQPPKRFERPPTKNVDHSPLRINDCLAGDDFLANDDTGIDSSSRAHGSDAASLGEDGSCLRGEEAGGEEEEEEENNSEALDLSLPK